MPSVEVMGPVPSFDEILEAVEQTERGRWFLAELRHRSQAASLSGIEASITKIERRLAQMPPASKAQVDWLKARDAIAKARSDIARLFNREPAADEERQAFARLAELARTAFPQETETASKPAILRALDLVTELDQNLLADAAAQDRFFEKDAALFEAPRAAAPAEDASATAGRGAKLVIVQNEAPPEPAQAQEPQPAKTEPRIVIVRHDPGEVMEVPLLPDSAPETAA